MDYRPLSKKVEEAGDAQWSANTQKIALQSEVKICI